MTLAFVEIQLFMSAREEYFGGDAPFSALQQELLKNPAAGAVIPGCGGLRKIRWPDPQRGKGRRGGLRVIYLYVLKAQVIVFIKVYDKDEADNLTSSQQKLLAALAEDLQRTILKRR